MRVNSKQLKTDRYLEEFRAREATARQVRERGITDEESHRDGGDSTSDLLRDAK
jgi:hypothetical protein